VAEPVLRGKKMTASTVYEFFRRKVKIVVLTLATYAALC